MNAFVPSGSAATVAGGTSVTILMRPQTPGLGAIANGVYTIPTGAYTLSDTYNGSNDDARLRNARCLRRSVPDHFHAGWRERTNSP